MRFNNKVVVVTGGGRGIGRAISTRFLDEGAVVVTAQRSQSDLRGAEHFHADFSKPEDCAAVILDQCATGLICNMGTCVAKPTLGEPCVNFQCADGFVCENNQCQEATPLSCSYAPGILD